MQLTRFTDYALRVMMHLGKQQQGKSTVREIASLHGVSYNHLIKVVHRLSSLGYIHSEKGRNGGIYLARPAQQIGIGELVREMEGSFKLVDCAGDGTGPCILIKNCRLKGVLDSAVNKFLHELDSYTLADLL